MIPPHTPEITIEIRAEMMMPIGTIACTPPCFTIESVVKVAPIISPICREITMPIFIEIFTDKEKDAQTLKDVYARFQSSKNSPKNILKSIFRGKNA